jgi:multiple sugar transport system permease protein
LDRGGGFTPVEVVSARERIFSLKGLLERQASLGIILMLPGALLLMVFMAYPFFLGIWLSMSDSMIGRMGHFIGLRNFIDLLGDSIFHQTVRNTFVYAMVTVPFKGRLYLGVNENVLKDNGGEYAVLVVRRPA